MRSTIFAIALALVIGGCDRYVDSRDPVRSLPSGGIVPTNLEAIIEDGAVTLTWTVSDSSDIVRYRIYLAESDSPLATYSLHDSTTATSIVINDLNLNSNYFFRVASVLVGGLESEWSEAVAATISFFSMAVNGDNEYTNNRDVVVRFNVPSQTTHVMVSEDSLFVGVDYVPFSVQRNFRLSEGDGAKVVCARLRFVDGSVSAVLKDEIVLDTRASIVSVLFGPSSVIFDVGDTVLFSLNAAETDGTAWVSFQGVSSLVLYDDGTGGDPVAGDGVYSARWVVPLGTNIYNGVVTGRFTDRAGNSAPAAAGGSYLNVNTPPQPVTLTGFLSGATANLNWTSSTESDFVAYRLYRSADASVDTTDVLVEYLATRTSTSFSETAQAGNSYYRVFVFDIHGAFVGSNTVTISN